MRRAAPPGRPLFRRRSRATCLPENGQTGVNELDASWRDIYYGAEVAGNLQLKLQCHAGAFPLCRQSQLQEHAARAGQQTGNFDPEQGAKMMRKTGIKQTGRCAERPAPCALRRGSCAEPAMPVLPLRPVLAGGLPSLRVRAKGKGQRQTRGDARASAKSGKAPDERYSPGPPRLSRASSLPSAACAGSARLHWVFSR